jgi:hypothetical protein
MAITVETSWRNRKIAGIVMRHCDPQKITRLIKNASRGWSQVAAGCEMTKEKKSSIERAGYHGHTEDVHRCKIGT